MCQLRNSCPRNDRKSSQCAKINRNLLNQSRVVGKIMCLNPGELLHKRYQIVSELGQGGFAKTYTARDLEIPKNRLCVVKEINFPSDSRLLLEAEKQFEREVRALHVLGQHSRIPNLFDSFQENGKFYLIQEYIEGEPLREELAQNTQWTEQQVVDFLEDILPVVAFVHQQNVIHRDITPSNLIRRKQDGKIVLIDFGCVKEISSLEITNSGETKTRAIGTQGYTAPEQLAGQPKFSSDIYSVGIIAIQALTGLHPAQDFLTGSRQGDIVWRYSTPERSMVQISNNLEMILNTMVRYHFPNRYQSVERILQDLNALQLTDSPSNFLPSPPQRKQVSRSRFRWLLFGSAGLVAALLIAIAMHYFFNSKPPVSVSGDSVSYGEEILVTTSAPWSKKRGIIEFANSNYQESLKLLKQSWREDRKDPETLIYINNALLEAKKSPYYTIAIVVPIRRNQQGVVVSGNVAEEMLRGIAQAQTEVNLGLLSAVENDFPGQGSLVAKTINGNGLKIIIADDANIKAEAVKRALSLVKLPNVLGIVGHYTSDMTVETIDIYNQNQLVAVSPGSTTEELTRRRREFLFRTSPTTSLEAESLVEYLRSVGQTKAVGFYNAGSPFSASLWEEFQKQFKGKGESIIKLREFEDLSKSDFDAKKAMQKVKELGGMTLVIVPDGQVTNATENALEIIKFNNDRNWIVGPSVLYELKTLEVAKQLRSFDRLVLAARWHPFNSPNKKFPQDAQKLWGGTVNNVTALTYDATKALIKAMEMQQQPSREGMQKMLANPSFIAEGATGTIQFEANGNRKNPPKELVHIVKCQKEQFGVTFVPINYPTAEAVGLNCK